MPLFQLHVSRLIMVFHFIYYILFVSVFVSNLQNLLLRIEGWKQISYVCYKTKNLFQRTNYTQEFFLVKMALFLFLNDEGGKLLFP